MSKDILDYNNSQSFEDKAICNLLYEQINKALPEAEKKIWHAHPVWFLDGNPIVGYSKQKNGIRLMFWSGMDFDEPALQPGTGKFKDASIFYKSADQIQIGNMAHWLEKSKHIQWDYKNLVKNRGRLNRIR